VRLRRRFTLLLIALLGVAVVVLPAAAGSETTPTVKTEDGNVYVEVHRWSPEQTSIAPAGMVTFVNGSATIPHGIIWTSSVAPVCEASVPVGSGNFKTSWSGSCSFAQAGEYAFYCSYHGPSMHGTVIVSAGGTTTTTTTPPPLPGGGTAGGNPTSPVEPGSQSVSAVPSSPLTGSALQAVKLASVQRGASVRGSVKVSAAGSGARLEVDLLAKGASLAVGGRAAQVRAGRLVRASVQAGTVSFTVALSAKARRALRAHRRLALAVRISLSPTHGSAVRIGRSVLLRA
jgi:plastocyanin